MRLPHVRFTVRRMMIATAFLGLALAAYRLHPSLGVFMGGVSCLMLARTFGTIDRCRAEGLPTPARWVFGVCFTSVIVANLLLVMPLSALCLISCILGPSPGSHPSPGDFIPGLVLGVPPATYLAYRLRQDLWPDEKTNSSPLDPAVRRTQPDAAGNDTSVL